MPDANPPRKPFSATPRAKPADVISCRATNPLSLHDDLSKVFIDERQAKATTATRLFRNDELFGALAKVVMPAYFSRRASSNRACVIWSSGCSSGEEVYSLAMVAMDAFEQKRIKPNIQAFGTDINRDRLAEARAGVYIRPGPQAISPAYQKILQRHAVMDNQNVHMSDDLRACCKFGVFDMRQKPKTHTFDFIVCNHVLQYYDQPGQIHILQNLTSVLRPGGYLYLEGITDGAHQAVHLKKVEERPNLFVPGR